MARDSGIGAGYVLAYPTALAIMAFLAVAVYNVVELTLVIFTTFKRRNGLYFYSLLVATWGIAPYCVGFFLKFYNLTTEAPTLYLTLIAIGWPCMITGQSLVLYSRLHLLTRSVIEKFRWVLAMIIFDAIICHIPIIVLLYGANSKNPEPFFNPYSIYEKVQITIFFVQEVIISGVYVLKTTRLLRSEGNILGRNSRTIMTHLVWVNLIIIALDIALLGIEYAGFYDLQTTFKAMVYSIKLKMEFSILNKLLDLFQGRIHDSSSDPRSRTHNGNTVTFGTTRRNQKTQSVAVAGAVNAMGNSAYARMEDGDLGIALKDMEVVKTTEITVERTKKIQEQDISEVDVESLREERRREGLAVGRSHSASSSEIQMVGGY